MPSVQVVPLHETTRERYLNYALSVITSRALPDIRDGLKPVQRRILYAMFANLRLYPDGRFRKSATVVGEVMGKYHPHGDTAIYDAMVRMAQPFSLRMPLVDGQGNFGSIDGDSPAAMRYTEAKLQALAMRLLDEIRKQTVDFRPNFDGTLSEPVVLPAQFPNLLVNGAVGIAVGMATSIPPHNLGEVIDALVYCIDHEDVSSRTLVERFIKGPDFPTAGRILNTEDEIVAVYEKGEGAIDVRGEYEREGKTRIIVRSIPFGVSKSALIESIADHILNDRVPQLVDVRDESTDDIRIVLELKRGADADAAMAYLLKHTPLQSRFHANVTALVPIEGSDVCSPARVDLKTILRYFLDFRMDVVTRRLRFDLDQLEKRIHILAGFEKIFNALDEAIKIIRASENKVDAAQRLMHRFRLDDIQADAVLETKLYKLSKLEIDAIREELAEKEERARSIRSLLDDEVARWELVRDELLTARTDFADARRTQVTGPEDLLYSAEDYIVDEDAYVIATRDGWVKRQRSYTERESIRVREGDEVQWILPGSTRATVGFFTNHGRVYSTRVDQLPSTTGHGVPVQKLFDFSDHEQVVGVVSFDERALPATGEAPAMASSLFEDGESDEGLAGPHVVAISSAGYGLRIPVAGFVEPSTKNGRIFMRLKDRQEVVRAEPSGGDENVCVASGGGFALIFPVDQLSVVRTAARGVIAMRLGKEDRVVGFTLAAGAREGLTVQTARGRSETIRTTKYQVSNRGNKGRAIVKRDGIKRVLYEPYEMVLE